jgi:hypothetical protein
VVMRAKTRAVRWIRTEFRDASILD